MTFTDEEVKVLWAAMWAMVCEVHSPQDCMSKEQWELAEKMHERIDARVNELEAGKR